MKYLILIYGNPQSRQAWEGFTDEQRAAGWGAYAALNEELTASGELVVSQALADPSLARRVPAREGSAPSGDGPYAEVKEQLAGFYLVECETVDRAMEVAGRIPEADYGLVEVRPVLDTGGMEM